MDISKSTYCNYLYCPKYCWLNIFKSAERTENTAAEQHALEGIAVGKLARGIFGKFTDVRESVGGKRPDNAALIARTKELLDSGADTICEASFGMDGYFCSVDILHREKGGYAIYEVKSSKYDDIGYRPDVAFQKYVLEKCGIFVTGTYLVLLSDSYIKNGKIQLDKLFKIVDYSKDIEGYVEVVEENCRQVQDVLNDAEPNLPLANGCDECAFWAYCSKDIPQPSVLNLGGRFGKWDKYNHGILTFQDVLKSGIKLSAKQQRQIDYTLNDLGTYVDKPKINEFLKGLTYPLYFLDFETMAPAVPEYDKTGCYQAIPFQYSLHIAESIGGAITHTEFLGEPEVDPRRALAEQLCRDIPKDVCTLAYHASVEKGIIEKLAAEFDDLAEHLLNIVAHIKDLENPFSKGYYYKREMGKRSSIKLVLPAIYPNDPELDYHNLKGVHNGDEAKLLYQGMKTMSAAERATMRENLLKYCWLDTYAMVKIWQELIRVGL